MTMLTPLGQRVCASSPCSRHQAGSWLNYHGSQPSQPSQQPLRCLTPIAFAQEVALQQQFQEPQRQQMQPLKLHMQRSWQEQFRKWEGIDKLLHIRNVCALLAAAACLLDVHVGPAAAAELGESIVQTEGNVPSELSSAGEAKGPRLSSLMEGANRKAVEGCTRRCVPTCIRGGEGAPGLGPLSLRKEIIVFKAGFRSRQYCLSECTQVCALISENQQQQQQLRGP